MFFSQEIYLLWSSIELFMSVTHLFLLLGIRNPKLTFIRTQKNYFLFDAMLHLINLILYLQLDKSIFIIFCLSLWLIIHQGPIPNDLHKLSRIFHWVSIEFEANRFHISKYTIEIFGTLSDITAHAFEFYFAFQKLLSFRYHLMTFIFMIGLLYRQMLNLPHFIYEPKMMPEFLRKLNNLIFNYSSNIQSKQS